jgi:hypothetical protein
MSNIRVLSVQHSNTSEASITLDTSGTVQFFSGKTTPAGWVKANGAALEAQP